MGWITESRSRQIKWRGRQMILSGGDIEVTVLGYAPPPQSSQIVEGVARVPFIAQIMSTEVDAVGMVPAQKMRLKDGLKSYVLTDAAPVYDGQAICGWTLIAAGGTG